MKAPRSVIPLRPSEPLLNRQTVITIACVVAAALLLGVVLKEPRRQCVLWSETPSAALVPR